MSCGVIGQDSSWLCGQQRPLYLSKVLHAVGWIEGFEKEEICYYAPLATSMPTHFFAWAAFLLHTEVQWYGLPLKKLPSHYHILISLICLDFWISFPQVTYVRYIDGWMDARYKLPLISLRDAIICLWKELFILWQQLGSKVGICACQGG